MSGIELYSHQETALALLRANDGFALFMEQGTGKTFPVLFRLAELAGQGKVRSALVVAPKAVCDGWREKIGQLSGEQRRQLGSIELRIASYDIAWRRGDIADGTFDAVVLDESHYVKSPSANRTKACIRIASRARYRWILTGTPTSNGQLCNLWSQMAVVDPVAVVSRGREYIYPGCLGGDSYYKWIERVALLDKWRKPRKYIDVQGVQEAVGALSYRITKAECLDLPEKLPDEVLRVSLDQTVKPKYRSMAKSSAILELDALAGNPLARSLRLRQIASGFIDTDDGRVELACRKPAALREFIGGFEGKFVVFCEFRRSIDEVSSVLAAEGVGHVVLDGRSPDKGVWREFQADPTVRAIICQYQTGSAGIDLYAADTCIFYEPTLRSDLNEQARDRIHRVGQTRACSYYYMLTEGTVETAIYRALRNYEDFSEALLTEYLSEYTKGERL
ncbi:DEAD/DEAH box helicase [Adlercreutzia sp. R25]|uniref:DEAD/DEAH box helicase n=1 Tax=Adlercreutzia shanghongiae TaxID=3111773 RepID=UPI002DBF3B92|nr:DEAD/DEAH box helicase [Adlercreutzia sp. R25]MEC4272923.1 DEAD/DEAH box helicase [Adlercreutzia sp. R25]